MFCDGDDRGEVNGLRHGLGRNGNSDQGGRVSKVIIKPHRHKGSSCYQKSRSWRISLWRKRISVKDKDGDKVEYQVWNPFRSKLTADILGGLDNIYISPKSKVLYLGTHVADIVDQVRTYISLK
ncbi:hypothetical protein Glove_351g17 [Diversispora epigaea]|uniref:rRNA 2'-O-methyltransferase fibrillarin n=1 Tax=Diversispora epigaea TaxID=1348612 RepID=A0A397HC05_9GLOM|nr:hypothetical protein Glove_351g17 [Diversispora epigaea]